MRPASELAGHLLRSGDGCARKLIAALGSTATAAALAIVLIARAGVLFASAGTTSTVDGSATIGGSEFQIQHCISPFLCVECA